MICIQTASDFGSVQGDDTPRGPRSRASSISSVASDSSFFTNVSFSHPQYVPSDIESEIEETSVNLDAISKEELYTYVKKYERRVIKYKTKYMEVGRDASDKAVEPQLNELISCYCLILTLRNEVDCLSKFEKINCK